MSTDIKPGQVWAWNDTTAARGDHNAQFEIVDAAPHAPDVAYQYRDDAEIDPEQTFGAPAKVVAENARLVKDTTPAPLDPSKKAPQPGDTLVWANSGIEVRVTELTPAAVVFAWPNGAVGQLPWSEWFNHLQPAPKPEWKPGTVGTALLLVGAAANSRRDVVRLTGNEFALEVHALVWADLDGNRYIESEVTDFVPDGPRPLPTPEDVRDVLASNLVAYRRDAKVLHDAALSVLAFIRGGAR